MIRVKTKASAVRTIAALVIGAAVVVSVAACSDLPAEVAASSCTPDFTAGSASNSVTANGTFGQDPKAHVPTPIVVNHVETTVTKKGKGLLLGPDDIGFVQLSLYTGADGKLAGTTGTNGFSKATEFQATAGQSNNPIAKSILCQRVGSRSVSAMTAADYFGSAATATAQGVPPKTTIVAVVDIERGYRGRAVGILQDPQAGFPSIVTAPDGTPGLTIDLQNKPTKLSTEVVRRGSGAKLKAGEKVILQVEGVEWSNPAPTTTFDSTWKAHAPRVYTLKAGTKTADGYFLDASSAKALVGQTVGSQVMVVVPPSAGYSSGNVPTGYPTGSTLIFVYDILGVD